MLPRPVQNSLMSLMDGGRLHKGDLESRVATQLRVRVFPARLLGSGLRLRACRTCRLNSRWRRLTATPQAAWRRSRARCVPTDIVACVRFAYQRAIQTGFFIGIIKRVKEESAAGRAPYGAPPPYGAYGAYGAPPPPYGAYGGPPPRGYGAPPPPYGAYGGPPAPPCAILIAPVCHCRSLTRRWPQSMAQATVVTQRRMIRVPVTVTVAESTTGSASAAGSVAESTTTAAATMTAGGTSATAAET